MLQSQMAFAKAPSAESFHGRKSVEDNHQVSKKDGDSIKDRNSKQDKDSRKDKDSKKDEHDESKIAGQTAAQAFEAQRQMFVQVFLHMKAKPNNARSAKLIQALRPSVLKFLEMPLTLVSETTTGDKTHLVFKSTDPSIDFLWSCTATKSGDHWDFNENDFKGKNSADIAVEPFTAVASAFPSEVSTLTFGMTLFVVALFASLISYIFLAIAAFQVSVVWGLVVLCVPCGNLIFAVCRWKEARVAFLANLISCVIAFIGLYIPMSVVMSLRDVLDLQPELSPSITDEQARQIIEDKLKQSKLNFKRIQ